MRLERQGQPLIPFERAIPQPGRGQVLIKMHASAVCRTDLHVIDGELPNVPLPIVPGHEIVGEVVGRGSGVQLRIGMRVGVTWLGSTCGLCEFCTHGHENLCNSAIFTGRHVDGGYAEHVLANARFCVELPAAFTDVDAAPLLCSGVIGYRCLRMAREPKRLGLYGFGAAAHIVAQVAIWQGREVYAFTRPGDEDAVAFALDLGAKWAGSSDQPPPVQLDAAIIFAPVGALVPHALRAVRKGGTVVCGGIHMSDIPAIPYSLLWEERSVRSVANLTRRDAREFLEIAPHVPIRVRTEIFPLRDANVALDRLRRGRLIGAAVLVPG